MQVAVFGVESVGEAQAPSGGDRADSPAPPPVVERLEEPSALGLHAASIMAHLPRFEAWLELHCPTVLSHCEDECKDEAVVLATRFGGFRQIASWGRGGACLSYALNQVVATHTPR